MPTLIHPGAFVHPRAKLGQDVEVMAGAVVTEWAELGDRVVVHPGAVIGGDPQYLNFDRSLASYVRVGADTVFREGATVNRSITADGATVVGARCYFMATAHAGHDCLVADDVILANQVLLGGHVEVGAFAFLGGASGVHQHCRIGTGAILGGMICMTLDLPPFCMGGRRNEVTGLNLVGMKRRAWPRETIREVKEAYRAVLRPVGNLRTAAAAHLPQVSSPQAREFLEFFAGGKRPSARPRSGRETSADE